MRRLTSITLAIFCVLCGRVAADDNIKSVIEKAIKAHGGKENLTKYKAVQMKADGKIFEGGMEIEFSASVAGQMPDKVREEISLEIMGQKITAIRFFDGKQGWKSRNGRMEDLTDAEIDEIKDDIFANYVESLVPLLTDKQLEVTLIGDSKVDDKPVVGVKVSKKGRKDLKLFFDKDSGLMIKSEHRTDHNGQEVDSETFNYDYKPVHGVMQAMKVVTNLDGKKYIEIKVSECKMLEKLDDSTFAKP